MVEDPLGAEEWIDLFQVRLQQQMLFSDPILYGPQDDSA